MFLPMWTMNAWMHTKCHWCVHQHWMHLDWHKGAPENWKNVGRVWHFAQKYCPYARIQREWAKINKFERTDDMLSWLAYDIVRSNDPERAPPLRFGDTSSDWGHPPYTQIYAYVGVVCVLSMFSSLYCLFAERGTFCHEQIDWWRRISPPFLRTRSVSHACEPPRITSTQTVHGPLIMSYLCWLMVVVTRHAHHPNPTDSSMLSTQRALLYRCIHHMIHVCSKSALPYCEE